MTNPTDPTRYPPPDPERIEQALGAMRARRARLRRVRAVGVSGVLVVFVAIVAVALSSNGGHRLRVAGPTSTTADTATTTKPTASTTSTTHTTSNTSTTTVRSAGTQQIVYRPYTETGNIDPSLRITASVTGTCITGESNRSYRCFGVSPAGVIYDPCFAAPSSADTFVCPNNPATSDVVKFTTTSPVSGSSATTARPWAFQLSSGEVCLFVSAAWSGLGPYDCQRNDSSVMPADCREPTSSQPWWSAECQNEKSDASPFTARHVSKVWF